MEKIKISTYRGFTAVSGETTLTDVIESIRNGKCSGVVKEIEALVRDEKIKQADELKKRLPFYTATGNYRGRRLAYDLIRYNPVILIDVDGVADRLVEPTRALIEKGSDVLASFLTPKRHGFKIFVFLRTAYAEKLRGIYLSSPQVTYDALEEFHARMYEASRAYIETLIGLPVDGSGKDISRGFFSSYDPQAYLNAALQEEIPEYDFEILAPSKEEANGAAKKKTKDIHKEISTECDTGEIIPDSSHESPQWERMEYKKALATTRRLEKFVEGNRDNFLFNLGNRCFRKGIPEESVCRFVTEEFSDVDMDLVSPVHNAYRYVSKTKKAKKKEQEEEKVPMVSQVMDFLKEHYGIRRNVILDRLEFMEKGKDKKYRPMRGKDYNSIFVSMQMAGVNCFQNYLRAVIDSDFAEDFNPFEHFFLKLKPWDGKTDFIARLANTVTTEDQAFWHESFKRWIVGMVACALKDEVVNQYALIMYSPQGLGKSTWIRHLLPPELQEYYRNGMINPDNKDDMLLTTTRLIINMEEFEGARMGDISALKRIITQESVTERKVYDMQAEKYVRRASFIASTNNSQCLQDISGNRRFLVSVIKSIDYLSEVDYEGVYSQAIHLMNHGYRYWYEGEEIKDLNARNEEYRMKDPVEENLYVYFRAARPTDYVTRWRPAAGILSVLCVYGRTQANRQTLQTVVQVLERDGFPKRVTEVGVTEYNVVEYSMEEVSENSKRLKV